MGIYDTYGKVQLKVGDVSMASYSIGDKVKIPDGLYVGYEGIVAIKDGKFLAEYDALETKWGEKIEASKLVAPLNPLNTVVADLKNDKEDR